MDVGIECMDTLGSHLYLRSVDITSGMEDLALQVGNANRVTIDDTEGTNPGSCQIKGCCATLGEFLGLSGSLCLSLCHGVDSPHPSRFREMT